MSTTSLLKTINIKTVNVKFRPIVNQDYHIIIQSWFFSNRVQERIILMIFLKCSAKTRYSNG